MYEKLLKINSRLELVCILHTAVSSNVIQWNPTITETHDSIQNRQTYTSGKLRKPLPDENWTVHYNLYTCTVQSVETVGQVVKLALLFTLVAKGWSLGRQ